MLLEGEEQHKQKNVDDGTSKINNYISNLMAGGKPDPVGAGGAFQWNSGAPPPEDEDEDPDRPAKWEDEEYRPDIELPLVIIALKHRSATSITISYDINIEAMTPLQTIRWPKNKAKVRDPLYEMEIRNSYGPAPNSKKKQNKRKDNVIPDSHKWRYFDG